MNHIECHLCNARVANVDEAIAAGWVPEWYEAGEQTPTAEPVCPMCQGEHLEPDEFGELVKVTD
jgi:hypothetical protein